MIIISLVFSSLGLSDDEKTNETSKTVMKATRRSQQRME
jgi:hypothetical protein